MSAWLVFTALGFYPVAPGANEYVIGRPFVSRAALRLANGKTFTVIADGLSDTNPYISSVTLNGHPLTRTALRDADIRAGGELHFVMGLRPDKSWGSSPRARPYSMSTQPYR